MNGLWLTERKSKAYCIFSEAETQIVVPPPARSNYNADHKANEMAPHHIKMLKSLTGIYWISSYKLLILQFF